LSGWNAVLPPTHLPDDTDVLKQMVVELLATVTQLRTTIDKQQAHIQYLVRLIFGRRTERVEGPALFDLNVPHRFIHGTASPSFGKGDVALVKLVDQNSLLRG
jgi:hypothetical protein